MHNPGRQKGIAHPQFKHGRYSDHLPSRLLSTYQESRSDPNLLDLTEQVALLQTRLVDVLKRVDTGESGRLWTQLREVYRDIEQAQREKDAVRIGQLMTDLGNLIARGHADWAAWASVLEISERLGKMSEREVKRRVQMQTMVTNEQATTLALALLDAVRRNVDDPNVLGRIGDEFVRITEGIDQRQPAITQA